MWDTNVRVNYDECEICGELWDLTVRSENDVLVRDEVIRSECEK